MSGPFEKYVEQAAEPLDPAAFDRADPQHDHWALDFRRGVARDRVRKVLAAVGPLIEEDTRDRMVTAAAASLDRDGGGEVSIRAKVAHLQDAADRWRAQSKLWDTGTDEQRGTPQQVADGREHAAELRCWARHLNRADILLDAPGAMP